MRTLQRCSVFLYRKERNERENQNNNNADNDNCIILPVTAFAVGDGKY